MVSTTECVKSFPAAFLTPRRVVARRRGIICCCLVKHRLILGLVVSVNKVFEPDDLYQRAPDMESESAWDKLLPREYLRLAMHWQGLGKAMNSQNTKHIIPMARSRSGPGHDPQRVGLTRDAGAEPIAPRTHGMDNRHTPTALPCKKYPFILSTRTPGPSPHPPEAYRVHF